MSSSSRLRAAHHLESAREVRRQIPPPPPPPPPPPVGCDALLLRPEARVREVLQDAVLDPHAPLERKALAVERLREEIGIGRIGVDRHALVGDLFADLVFRRRASRTGSRPSSADAGVERAAQLRNEIGDGLRLEHHRVHARLDRRRDCGTRPPSAQRGHRARRDRSLPSRARRPTPSPNRCRPACAPSWKDSHRSSDDTRTARDCSRSRARPRSPRDKPATNTSPAGRPTSPARSITRFAAAARASAPRFAVASMKPLTCRVRSARRAPA